MTENELYILSVWENHNDPSKWVYDICPASQFYYNSYRYMINNKAPYYYSSIYQGTYKECNDFINFIKDNFS